MPRAGRMTQVTYVTENKLNRLKQYHDNTSFFEPGDAFMEMDEKLIMKSCLSWKNSVRAGWYHIVRLPVWNYPCHRVVNHACRPCAPFLRTAKKADWRRNHIPGYGNADMIKHQWQYWKSRVPHWKENKNSVFSPLSQLQLTKGAKTGIVQPWGRENPRPNLHP